jgi:hypothetical protein
MPSPTPPPFCSPSDPRFWRGGVARRERAALLVAEWVTIRMRKHSNGQSPFAHSAHSTLSRADVLPCSFSVKRSLREEATARESIRSRERAGSRRAKHEPGGSPFDELIESQATDATPRRVHPAIDPKCHPPMGPIQCGSAGEELIPFGTAHELRARIESTRTRRYSSPEHLLEPDRVARDSWESGRRIAT